MAPTPDDHDERLDRVREAHADGPDDEYEVEGCSDDYPEHQTRDTYRGEDGVQWECVRCGAEGWEPAE